jgi:hypothetical protein
VSVTSTELVTGGISSGISAISYNSSSTGDVNVSAYYATGGAFGIFARNDGAGSISITSAGDITGTFGAGISAQNMGATGGDLVISTNVVSGTSGINAQNNGTGILSITSVGSVTGSGSRGIDASNTGNASGDLTILATHVSGYGEAIAARNYGSGSLSVTSTGDVSSSLIGVSAFNLSPSSGDMAIAVARVDGGVDGIFANHYGVGSLTITASGPVTGATRFGITAQNGANATGDFNITAEDVTGGLHGITATHIGTGALSISTTGVVNGQAGVGIQAINSAIAVGDFTIEAATANGGVTGIDARNYGTGEMYIRSSGTISGGNDGILALNSSGGTNLFISSPPWVAQ